MEERRIQLIICWFALVLLYLLGDVLRVYEKGEAVAIIDGKRMDQTMFLLAALLMVTPILMAIASAFLPLGIVRWASIIVALVLFIINAAGVLSYDSLYDRLLIIVGLLLNLFTVYVAWTWK